MGLPGSGKTYLATYLVAQMQQEKKKVGWLNVPHATANAGHVPRVTLQLTGIVTKATRTFLTHLRNNRQVRI